MPPIVTDSYGYVLYGRVADLMVLTTIEVTLMTTEAIRKVFRLPKRISYLFATLLGHFGAPFLLPAPMEMCGARAEMCGAIPRIPVFTALGHRRCGAMRGAFSCCN